MFYDFSSLHNCPSSGQLCKKYLGKEASQRNRRNFVSGLGAGGARNMRDQVGRGGGRILKESTGKGGYFRVWWKSGARETPRNIQR